MSAYSTPPEFSQLRLIDSETSLQSRVNTRHKKQVQETFAKIRQLHDELNAQLYAHPRQRPTIHAPADAADILRPFIALLDHEELWVICLDTRNHVMSLVQLYKGSVNSSQVRIAEVFRQAILDNCPAIIIAHCHPSGDVTPSPDDVAVTRAIVQGGKLLDISLLDHLILGGEHFCSLKERGLGFA